MTCPHRIPYRIGINLGDVIAEELLWNRFTFSGLRITNTCVKECWRQNCRPKSGLIFCSDI